MLNYKNKKFEIKIIETLHRVEMAHAESFEEALEKIYGLYKKEEIILDWSDFVSVEFSNFYLYPTVFEITNTEVFEYFKELKEKGKIDKNKKISEKEIRKVLDFVECDELLAKDIRKSIKNSILEIIK